MWTATHPVLLVSPMSCGQCAHRGAGSPALKNKLHLRGSTTPAGIVEARPTVPRAVPLPLMPPCPCPLWILAPGHPGAAAAPLSTVEPHLHRNRRGKRSPRSTHFSSRLSPPRAACCGGFNFPRRSRAFCHCISASHRCPLGASCHHMLSSGRRQRALPSRPLHQPTGPARPPAAGQRGGGGGRRGLRARPEARQWAAAALPPWLPVGGRRSWCHRGRGQRGEEASREAGREERAAGGRGEVYSRRHLSRARRRCRPAPAAAQAARLGHAPPRCRPGLVTAGRRPPVPTQARAATGVTSASGVRTERGRLSPASRPPPAPSPSFSSPLPGA